MIIKVKGVAKIARKLGFDYAEAVVRAFLNLIVQLDITADFEIALPKFNDVATLSHRLDLSLKNAELFP